MKNQEVYTGPLISCDQSFNIVLYPSTLRKNVDGKVVETHLEHYVFLRGDDVYFISPNKVAQIHQAKEFDPLDADLLPF